MNRWRRIRPGTARIVAALLLFTASGASFAQEVQRHGVVFEKWVRDTFFAGYQPPSYTQKWDIPAEVNKEHGGLPANPKAAKWGSPVDLGDALRQFDIAHGTESFLLIVGFWQQTSPTEKRLVNVQAVTVSPEIYRLLWGQVTRADLERLDAAIKDKSLTLAEARARAQKIKAEPAFQGMSVTLNPKIDVSQRRLQCSLSFKNFFAKLAPSADATLQARPELFGTPVPATIESSPRRLPKKNAEPAGK